MGLTWRAWVADWASILARDQSDHALHVFVLFFDGGTISSLRQSAERCSTLSRADWVQFEVQIMSSANVIELLFLAAVVVLAILAIRFFRKRS